MGIHLYRELLVDRIGITVSIPSPDLYGFALEGLESFKSEPSFHIPGGKAKRWKDKYTTRMDYYASWSHKKAGRRKIAEITVGSHGTPAKKKINRYLTLGLYPSQFKAGEFEHLQAVLNKFLPEFAYGKLYHTGRVNYLELAADTFSQQHHSFLPWRKYVTVSEIYKEKGTGERGTTYIGSRSRNSKEFFRIYDKRRQLLAKGLPPLNGLPVHTRIEAVQRRLGCSPCDLAAMSNPFEVLLIADTEAAKGLTGDENWQEFLSVCQTVDGVPDTLAALPGYWRKKFRGWLDGCPVWWWGPALIWTHLPEALARIAPTPLPNFLEP